MSHNWMVFVPAATTNDETLLHSIAGIHSPSPNSDARATFNSSSSRDRIAQIVHDKILNTISVALVLALRLYTSLVHIKAPCLLVYQLKYCQRHLVCASCLSVDRGLV
jgi:hypothetical protein